MNFPLIADPVFYMAALPAVIIVGASKSGFGGGLGLIAVPLLTLSVAPQTAAAVMLPVLCIIDIYTLIVYRKNWDAANLRILLPAALIGIIIGAATFHLMTEAAIKGMVALVALSFTVDYFFRGKKRAGNAAATPSVGKGGFWGAVSGFTSFIAHAGGPPLSVYMLPQRMDKTRFVGTTVIFFITVNYVKLLPYAMLGQFHAENLATSVVLVPIALFGAWLGIWAHKRVNEIWFYRFCYVMLFLTGLKLAQEAIWELL